MKDALGHGSNGQLHGGLPMRSQNAFSNGASSNRADFARNKIGIASGATFEKAGQSGVRTREQMNPSTADRVAALRSRMQANSGSPGHLAALAQGLKNLVGMS
jgi:hypothetical protein